MIKDLLFSLSESTCITGRGKAADVIFNESKKIADNVRRDNLGNVVAEVKKREEGKPNILLEAHMDEIGFIVTTIDEDGFLHIDKVGGPDLRILLGHDVIVHANEEIFGVVCCRPPHLSTGEDRKVTPKLEDIAVDIGYTHDEAVNKVKPGDFITFRREPAELMNGLITGKSLDNRAGCAAVLRSIEILKDKNLDCGLTAAFTLHEELGGQGAATAAYTVNPTHAIVVDVGFGFTPDTPRERCGDLKKGAMIGIAPILSREITDIMFEEAKKKNLPYQPDIMSNSTGTNADTITITRGGVKTGLVSIPLRYMHTSAETIAAEDVETVAEVLAAAVERIGGGSNENV